EVGFSWLARHQPRAAGGEHLRNATLPVFHAVRVDTDPIRTKDVDVAHPGLSRQLGRHVGGRCGQPEDPARVQVFVDQLSGGSLVEQAPVAQDADVVGDALNVGQDVAGEDDGPLPTHAGHQIQDV